MNAHTKLPEYQTREYETVLVDVEDSTLILTINRMERYNALSGQVRRDMGHVLEQVAQDRAIRAVVLWGGTKAFVAGADVKELREMRPLEVFSKMSPNPDIWDMIARLPQPVIAAIAGHAVGGGLELALACDLRIAADNALLGQTEVNLSLIPGRGGTQRLARYIGMPKAKEMVLLGDMLKADEALAAGLVSKVVPTADLLDEAKALAARIAQKSPQAVTMAKLILNLGNDAPLEAALTMESLAFAGMFSTDDMQEGIDAFITKRRPEYKGT